MLWTCFLVGMESSGFDKDPCIGWDVLRVLDVLVLRNFLLYILLSKLRSFSFLFSLFFLMRSVMKLLKLSMDCKLAGDDYFMFLLIYLTSLYICGVKLGFKLFMLPK